jgi:multiple sugar transport system ATP-binding protein
VAAFVGSPSMNFIPVTGIETGADGLRINVAGAQLATTIRQQPKDKGELTLGVRPESLRVAQDGAGDITGQIALVERLGDRTLVHVTLADGSNVVAEDEGKSTLAAGGPVSLKVDGTATHLFDAAGLAYHAD